MENNNNVSYGIAFDNVLKKVYLNSFYRGERLKEGSNLSAARMQSGSDDKDILTDELELAVADVVAVMNQFLGTFSYTKGTDSFSISGKACVLFPFLENKDSVINAIETYCVHKVLEGWLLINQPEEVQNIGAKVAECAEKLRVLFCKRRKPV